jgi:hypothetical protein
MLRLWGYQVVFLCEFPTHSVWVLTPWTWLFSPVMLFTQLVFWISLWGTSACLTYCHLCTDYILLPTYWLQDWTVVRGKGILINSFCV